MLLGGGGGEGLPRLAQLVELSEVAFDLLLPLWGAHCPPPHHTPSLYQFKV